MDPRSTRTRSTRTRRIVSLLLLGAAAAPSAQAQVPYDSCGEVIQGVTCTLIFRDDNNTTWLLDDYGSFTVGDRVRVVGDADPGCGTFCMQGGCITVASISACAPTTRGYCFGDGSSTPCPCGNFGGTGEGCANSSGAGASLAPSGSASVSADDLLVGASNLLPGQPVLLFGANNAVNGGNGIVYGDGLRCAGGGLVRLGVRTPDAGGTAGWGPGLATQAGYAPGQTVRMQVWYRDPLGSPCGSGFNLSHGIELSFLP